MKVNVCSSFSFPSQGRSYVVPTSNYAALASVYTVRYVSGAWLAMEVQIGSPTSRRALDMCYTLSWVWLSIGHSWAGPEEGDLSGEIKCFSHLWLCLTLGLWLKFHLAENNLIYFRCSYKLQVVQRSSCHKPLHRFSWFTRVPTDPGTDLWMTVNSASG